MRTILILLLICGNCFSQSVLFNSKVATNNNVIINRIEQAPTASSIVVSGQYILDSTLTVTYAYEDLNGDAAQTATYQWYRADDANGTGQAAIAGATNTTYTLVSADSIKYVYVGVIPKNAKATGSEVLSAKDCPDLHMFYFNSIQPGTLDQISITLNIKIGSKVWINWGNGTITAVTANLVDQVITSNYASINTTYKAKLVGDLTQITTFSVSSEVTMSLVNINNFGVKFTGLTSLTLYTLGTNFTGSISSLPTGLTSLTLNTLGTNLTGSISSLPTGLTSLTLYKIGTGIDITTGTMPAWVNNTITITSGYTTASVDGFLNAWSATATGTTAKTINLTGTGEGIANQARSAASDDAVTHLTVTHSKIIQTTP